jgi:pimeloyl-ACP methyl ester carboxylesterase
MPHRAARPQPAAATPGSAGRIVFSHANSFPAGTYRQLFERWRAAGYEVHALPMFGHDPRYPVSSNWPHLCKQLADFISAEVPGPACLVGHSLGGLLSLMVACRRPELASGLVMLDSPVIAGWRAHSVQVIKATRLIGRVSPGKVSQHRRYEWPSREAAREHFAGKHSFARWAPGMLDDYIAAGMREEGGRTVLAFTREVETRIYNTLPHNLPQLLHRHPPRCPVGFIAGTRSAEMRQGGLGGARALARERLRFIEGSHLYPMEKPRETADLVLALIKDMATP